MIAWLHESENTYVVMLSWYALIVTFGLNANALSRATIAFDLPTCSLWNKNWRFRLLTSMVSKSIYRKQGRERKRQRMRTILWNTFYSSLDNGRHTWRTEFYLRFQCRKIRSSQDFSILRIRCHQHQQPIFCFRWLSLEAMARVRRLHWLPYLTAMNTDSAIKKIYSE